MNKKSIKLRTAMMISFSVLIIIAMIAMTFFSNNLFYKNYEESMINNTNQIIQQVALNINTYLENVEEDMEAIATDKNVIDHLTEYRSASDYNRLQIKKKIYNILISRRNISTDVDNIILYNEELVYHAQGQGKSLKINSQTLQKLWDKVKNAEAQSKGYEILEDPLYYGDKEHLDNIIINMPIRDIHNYNREQVSLLIYEINISKIKNIVMDIENQQDGYFIITNDKGQIIYATDKRGEAFYNGLMDTKDIERETTHVIIEDEQHLVSNTTLSANDWTLWFMTPYGDFYDTIDKNQQLTFLFTGILILVAMLISLFISIGLSQPFMYLEKNMRSLGKGKFKQLKLNHTYFKEVKLIYQSFNRMSSELQKLIYDNYHLKIIQKNAEFEALQAKINPHFLYNTLNSIISLSVLEKNDEVQKVTLALADLLAYTVYEEDELIPLEKELEYIEHYIYIQNVRFDHSIEFNSIIDQEIIGSNILKFSIQPLIENAIVHGLREIEGKRYLTLSIKALNDHVRVSIEDHGKGISDERLKVIRGILEAEEHMDNSIGLYNINSRLRIKYGKAYGLHIASKQGEGTRVWFDVPLHP